MLISTDRAPLSDVVEISAAYMLMWTSRSGARQFVDISTSRAAEGPGWRRRHE
jgi:hypothetical protein